jgi:hypothetical protein
MAKQIPPADWPVMPHANSQLPKRFSRTMKKFKKYEGMCIARCLSSQQLQCCEALPGCCKTSGPRSGCAGVWCESPVLGPGQVEEGGHTSYPHRSRLELTCRPGHLQKGDLAITCQANGKWSRPDGACHRKSLLLYSTVTLCYLLLFSSIVRIRTLWREFRI